MRALFVLILGLLLAPLAQAQEDRSYIGCDLGAGGAACTEIPYGLGDVGTVTDFAEVALLPDGGKEPIFIGPGDGSCGGDNDPPLLPLTGQVWLRERNDCVVSATNRCLIEMPQRIGESGFFITAVVLFDFGPLGLFASSANTLEDIGRGGNVGHRQLNGTCTNDGGEDCALDSDCASGTGCLSTCFDDPTTLCGSHQDCVDAGLPENNCVTMAFWDDVGTCTDDATLCTTDADCPAPEICEPGVDWGAIGVHVRLLPELHRRPVRLVGACRISGTQLPGARTAVAGRRSGSPMGVRGRQGHRVQAEAEPDSGAARG